MRRASSEAEKRMRKAVEATLRRTGVEPRREPEYLRGVSSMRRRSFLVLSSLSLCGGLWLAGCGGGGNGSGSGGATLSGGAPGSGGAVASGGSSAGGATSSGGSASGGASTGGTSAGGASNSGGATGDTGGASAGGGDTGSGGDGSGGGSSDPATVMNNGGKVTITWGTRTLVVDGTKGARITSLKSGTSEFLVPPPSANPSGDDLYKYGSTFWTAPQTDWSWPPIVPIDSAEYTVAVDGATATFTSGSASVTTGKDVRIKKAFSVDTSKDVITIVYTIENPGAAQFSIAPWEITRVPTGGLTFFPTGASSFTPDGMDMLTVTSQSGITWFQHSAQTAEGKIHADGSEGWLTHATSSLALIKSFANLADGAAAPGEGEVEIYAAGDGSYVEVENQGEYKTLGGTPLTYEVRWLLRDIPGTVTVGAGSATLATFVRDELTAAGL